MIIMGDEEKGCTFAFLEIEEKFDDGGSGFLIQISGRFIGKNDAGT
jgi:hypothetical protein